MSYRIVITIPYITDKDLLKMNTMHPGIVNLYGMKRTIIPIDVFEDERKRLNKTLERYETVYNRECKVLPDNFVESKESLKAVGIDIYFGHYIYFNTEHKHWVLSIAIRD